MTLNYYNAEMTENKTGKPEPLFIKLIREKTSKETLNDIVDSGLREKYNRCIELILRTEDHRVAAKHLSTCIEECETLAREICDNYKQNIKPRCSQQMNFLQKHINGLASKGVPVLSVYDADPMIAFTFLNSIGYYSLLLAFLSVAMKIDMSSTPLEINSLISKIYN